MASATVKKKESNKERKRDNERENAKSRATAKRHRAHGNGRRATKGGKEISQESIVHTQSRRDRQTERER